MIAVVLEFDVISGKEDAFIDSWNKTTEVIYENFGSLGSRLHRAKEGKFIAYAQWPSKEVYENEQHWPEQALKHRDKMRSTLTNGKPTLLYQLALVSDQLKTEVFKN